MIERVQTSGSDDGRPRRMPETGAHIETHLKAQWRSYALLGAIVAALTASFFPAWVWSSVS